MNVRFVSSTDCGQLLNIYNDYISTPVTFEYTLPTEQEFLNRIKNISSQYPYLVLEENEEIRGYAYAHRYLERAAYQWGAELSIYLSPLITAKGYGKKLYALLISLLSLQGIKTLYGLVTLPNEKSEKLHMSMGFRTLGIYQKAGFKAGNWYDVAIYEKMIAEYDANPKPITSIHAIEDNTCNHLFQTFMDI